MTTLERTGWGLLAGCLTLGLGGCEETVDGEYLDTEGIALVATVTADSDQAARMELEFLAGGDESNTYVDLSGDKVVAGGGDQKLNLNVDDPGRYDANFGTGAADTEFTIALDRKDEDKRDAPDTIGTLPEPFTISVDAQGDVSRQDALTVTWEPSGTADEVRVDVDGDCIFYTFDSGEADDGSFTFPAQEFVFGNDKSMDEKGTCEATITITRTRFGDVDSVFDSESTFRLSQVRSTTFTSTQ